MKRLYYIIAIQLLNATACAMECFDLLPFELHGKIVKNIFNVVIHEDDELLKYTDQKELEKYILKTPVTLGMKFVHEFDQMHKLCQDTIGGKKFIAQELFCLPREHRDVFIRMAQRSYVRQIVEGNISAEDYEIITKLNDETIKKGLRLEVLSVNRVLNGMEFIGGSAAITSWLVLSALIQTNSLKGKMVKIPVVGAVGGLCLFGIAQFLMYCSNPKHRYSKNLKKIKL